MSVFQQSRAGLNLSPAARAFLKLCEGFLVAGIVAASPVVAQLLGQQSVNWSQTLRLAGAAFAVAVLLAVVKYCKAHMDAPLAAPIAALAGDIGQSIATHASASDPIIPFSAPTVTTVTLSSAGASASASSAPATGV